MDSSGDECDLIMPIGPKSARTLALAKLEDPTPAYVLHFETIQHCTLVERRQVPTREERAAWESKKLAVDANGVRLIADPCYRPKVEELRNRLFGVARRNHNRRVVD